MSDYGTAAERRARRFAERHDEFLRRALLAMRARGLSALNLTDLAQGSGYSKGTWYNHFSSAQALYLEIATRNAELQGRYAADILERPALPAGEQLASVFLSSVVHSILHPEIWSLSTYARVWDSSGDEDLLRVGERLARAEQDNYERILGIATRAHHRLREPGVEIARALDIVRAATDGLSVLTASAEAHRWSETVTNEQSSTLLRAALSAADFETPSREAMNTLCGLNRTRVAEISAEWILADTAE